MITIAVLAALVATVAAVNIIAVRWEHRPQQIEEKR